MGWDETGRGAEERRSGIFISMDIYMDILHGYGYVYSSSRRNEDIRRQAFAAWDSDGEGSEPNRGIVDA